MSAQFIARHRFATLVEDLVEDLIEAGLLSAFAPSPATVLIVMFFGVPEHRLEIIRVNPDLISRMPHSVLAESKIETANTGLALGLITPGFAAGESFIAESFQMARSPDVNGCFLGPT